MVSQSSGITIVVLLLLLGSLTISATASLLEDVFLSSQHHEQNWVDSFNPVEQVNITMIGYNNMIHSELAPLHYPSVVSLSELENSLPKLETIDMTIHRMGDKRDIILLLVKHQKLISKDFSLKYQNDDGFFKTEFLNETLPFFNPEHCYFATLPENIIAASINLCEGISGYIQFGSEEYDLSSARRDNSTDDNFISTKFVANSTIDPDILLDKFKLNKKHEVQNHISKRDLDDIWSPIPLYYEIYFVVDYTLAQEEIYKSPQLLLKHIFYLVSLANTYYIEFNLGLVLKTIDIWSDRPRLHPNLTHTCAEKEGGLGSNSSHQWYWGFQKYQYNDTEMLNSDVRVALLAEPPPECFVAGTAWTLRLCSINSTVVVSKTPSLFYTAISLTHEIGHNLGADHTENMNDSSWCRDILTQENGEDPCYNQTETADYQCIMSAGHRSVPQEKKEVYYFSKCSKRHINRYIQILGSCMHNDPSSNKHYHICGNLLVEPGEQCDAGYYGNECCTAGCKLKHEDANCHKGSCCNMTSCRLLPSSVTCREAEDEFCDEHEVCDGINPECPEDIRLPSGRPCNIMGPAVCFHGKCRSHSSQCAGIWNGSYAAHDSCYDLNLYTNASGNCGYALGQWGVYKFRPCTGRLYPACGLLQCEVSASELESHNKTQFLQPQVIDLGGKGKVCTSVMLRPTEVSNFEFDPTQVSDGAKCGPHHACYRGACWDLKNQKYKYYDERHTSQVPDIPAPTIETTTAPPSTMEPGWPSEKRVTRKHIGLLTEKAPVEYYSTGSDDVLITTIPAEILADRRGVGSDGIFFASLIGVPLVALLVLVASFIVNEVLRRRN